MEILSSGCGDVRPMLGMDPEFFLVRDGVPVAAEEALPPQAEALKSPHSNDYRGFVSSAYRDGFQGELGIAPSVCRAYVMDNIIFAAREAYNAAKAVGLDLLLEPAVDVSLETLAAVKDPNSARFGCDPDFSADFGGLPNIVNVDASKHPVRYAGAHLHFGSGAMKIKPEFLEKKRGVTWALHDLEGQLETVFCLDITVGLPCVLLEGPQDQRRRQYYGKAGSFRTPPHGLEYRVPSNVILQAPPITNLILSLGRAGVAMAAHKLREKHFDLPREEVVAAINEGNKELAFKLFSQIRRNLGILGEYDCCDHFGLNVFEYMLQNGTARDWFPEPFTEVWHLTETVRPDHGNLTMSWHEWANESVVDRKGWKKFIKSKRTV